MNEESLTWHSWKDWKEIYKLFHLLCQNNNSAIRMCIDLEYYCSALYSAVLLCCTWLSKKCGTVIIKTLMIQWTCLKYKSILLKDKAPNFRWTSISQAQDTVHTCSSCCHFLWWEVQCHVNPISANCLRQTWNSCPHESNVTVCLYWSVDVYN